MSPMKILIKTEDGSLLDFEYVIKVGQNRYGVGAFMDRSGNSMVLFKCDNPDLYQLWMERFDQELSYANGSEASVYTIDINDHVRDLYKFQQNEGKNDADSN